jgi:hypothetical protein
MPIRKNKELSHELLLLDRLPISSTIPGNILGDDQLWSSPRFLLLVHNEVIYIVSHPGKESGITLLNYILHDLVMAFLIVIQVQLELLYQLMRIYQWPFVDVFRELNNLVCHVE